MDLSEMQARAVELERLIFFLPAGSITKKSVNGKEYFYHRWTENKKRREKYIPADELEDFRAQIERRKELEQELKALKKQLPKAKSANLSAFTTNVRTGEALRSFAASIRGYAQADALIRSLLLDETFSALSLAERTAVQQRILTEIKGRMLEDIVLLETKLANPKKQVFVLQFPVGEFDMVVFDPEAGSCRIFEIKHSEEAASQQYRHLIDEQKCAQTEHRYGPITGKLVLYRGESQVVEGIQYQNVEEYLRSLA